jgi:hypothetical protein
MDNYKMKDLQIRLEKETKEDAHKMIYMWIKQNILSLKEYQHLVKKLTIPDVSKCACHPLVACEICGEEKNLDGDFWKNKKKHDC